MKTIHLFLASSIEEFKDERIFIGDFVRKLNNRSLIKGYQVRLFLCEDESDNYQPTYDRQISKSDVFIALIGSHLGKYTEHELFEAKSSNNIKKRIIATNSWSSESLIPNEIKPYFENKVFENYFLDNVLGLIEKESELVLSLLEESTPLLPQTICKLAIPDIPGTIEGAIIGNAIRGFNDQHEGEFVIEANESLIAQSYDAYITLLSDGFNSEIFRTQNLLNANTALEALWIFSKKSPLAQNISAIITKLAEKNKFTEEYESFDELSLKFKNQLKDKVLNMIIGMWIYDQFDYEIENHLLIRKSWITGNDFIIKNLALIDNNPETQRRKENIIKNLLNYYHTTRQKFDKYKEALKALQDSNYDYFAYDPSIIMHLPVNQYEAVIDYVNDSLESLQKKIVDYPDDAILAEVILAEVNGIVRFLKESRYKIEPKDEFGINYRIGTILSSYANNYGTLIDETEQHFIDAMQSYRRLTSPQIYEKDKAIKTLLHLCEINQLKNKDEDMDYWVDYGFDIIGEKTEKSGVENSNYRLIDYKFLLYVYRAQATIISDREKANDIYCQAAKLVENYNQNNSTLNRYIQVRYEVIMNDIMLDKNVDDYKDEVDELLKKYKKYLAKDDTYPSLCSKVYLLILQSKIENNLSIWIDAMGFVENNQLFGPYDLRYLYMIYVGSDLYQKCHQTKEAVILLDYLSQVSKGNRDKAIYQQNKALACCLDLYEDANYLQQAENAYNEALSLFAKMNEKEHVGNVYDGLSFCYILQKKFDKAECFAKKAIATTEYECTNKYGNYLSSLLCQGHFFKACKYFYYDFRRKNRIEIRKGLMKDWSDEAEMTKVGINTKKFKRLFLLYDFFQKQSPQS